MPPRGMAGHTGFREQIKQKIMDKCHVLKAHRRK